MPNYVTAALTKFQHSRPSQPKYSPHDWNQPVYGQRIQYTPESSTSEPLSLLIPSFANLSSALSSITPMQSTPPCSLNELLTQQYSPTQDTLSKCHRLLNYAATYPTATTSIRYHASDMILTVNTDAAYLVVLPKACSSVAGYFYLSNITPDYRTSTPMPNGSILVECHGLHNVVSCAAEAETGGTFHNAQSFFAQSPQSHYPIGLEIWCSLPDS